MIVVVKEMETIVAAVKTALGWGVLNYQYGYVKELNTTLQQWSKDKDNMAKKYPLIWVAQPFRVDKSIPVYWGRTKLKIFLIQQSSDDLKAKKRIDDKFIPFIYPMRDELLNQLGLSERFTTTDQLFQFTITETDRYFWGDNQKKVIDDTIDCLELDIDLNIYHEDCLTN